MVIRQIKKKQWDDVYNQITTLSREVPMTFQYDVELNCNGTAYILRVQPIQNRKIVALHVLRVGQDENGTHEKQFNLIDNNLLLSSLLEIILYQSREKQSA